MREKPVNCHTIPPFNRITPACAGKTFFKLFIFQFIWDHPRVCGKNSERCKKSRISSGSPPRVREKPFITYVTCGRVGITPACAGKTQRDVKSRGYRQDHPRVCGKNLSRTRALHRCKGSPPRVREKLLSTLVYKVVTRITPACAGKTRATYATDTRERDHPRVCGKNILFSSLMTSILGSPPRVREKPLFAGVNPSP